MSNKITVIKLPDSNKIKLETSNKKSSKSPQTFGNKMTHK